MIREKEVTELRSQGKTYQEIANELSITRQRVGQYLSPNNPHMFRHWTEDSCAYAGLRKWLNDNQVTMRQLVIQLGYKYLSGTVSRTRLKLNGKTQMNMDIILRIIDLTGLTFEELFFTPKGD